MNEKHVESKSVKREKSEGSQGLGVGVGVGGGGVGVMHANRCSMLRVFMVM